jgi:hypothetical protein
VVIDAAPRSRVANSQPAGIGRVARVGGGCAWNNLGRNVVFADESLRPVAIFGDTVFPHDDEPSQYDLDVHAVVDVGDRGRVAVVNHYGLVRLFDAPWPSAPPGRAEPGLTETARLDFVADVERIAAVGDRLVTSRPRGERLGGALVTESLRSDRHRLDADVIEEAFGFVTALAASGVGDDDRWAALGGEERVRLVATGPGGGWTVQWETPVDFLVSVLVADGATLWAAGSASGGTDLDDYDWEQLRGGGWARLDLSDGTVLASAPVHPDLAWGSGGVPFVVADGVPCGFGRRGELHVLRPDAVDVAPVTDELSPRSLGIGHAAVIGDQIVVGFNRGGYRLEAVPVQAVHHRERRRPPPGRRA